MFLNTCVFCRLFFKSLSTKVLYKLSCSLEPSKSLRDAKNVNKKHLSPKYCRKNHIVKYIKLIQTDCIKLWQPLSIPKKLQIVKTQE